MTFEIQELHIGHDRQSFSCGCKQLDDYLHSLASQDMKRDICKVYVAISANDGSVCGYYTLSCMSTDFDEIPEDCRKRLPSTIPIPSILIGRMAVSISCQGQRLGSALLFDAFKRCASTGIGAAMVIVDSLPSSESFWIKAGFTPGLDRGGTKRMFYSMRKVRKDIEI